MDDWSYSDDAIDAAANTEGWQDPKGRVLSDRVWLAGEIAAEAISNILNDGIANGTSANEVARQARQYLVDPHAGGYPARRLARTELTRAFGQGTLSAAQNNPLIIGVRWTVSGSHPKTDICDANARGGPTGNGIYPPRDVPRYPQHPMCKCVLSPVPMETGDAVKLLRRRAGLGPDENPYTLGKRPLINRRSGAPTKRPMGVTVRRPPPPWPTKIKRISGQAVRQVRDTTRAIKGGARSTQRFIRRVDRIVRMPRRSLPVRVLFGNPRHRILSRIKHFAKTRFVPIPVKRGIRNYRRLKNEVRRQAAGIKRFVRHPIRTTVRTARRKALTIYRPRMPGRYLLAKAKRTYATLNEFSHGPAAFYKKRAIARLESFARRGGVVGALRRRAKRVLQVTFPGLSKLDNRRPYTALTNNIELNSPSWTLAPLRDVRSLYIVRRDAPDGVLQAIKAADSVHKVRGVSKIPVEGYNYPTNNGAYYRGSSGKPRLIYVGDPENYYPAHMRANDPAWTMIHEMGHHMDTTEKGILASVYRRPTEMHSWAAAVGRSAGYRAMKADKSEYMQYRIQIDEMWAWSYAQWVATRSQDPRLMAALNADRGYVPRPAFVPIVKREYTMLELYAMRDEEEEDEVLPILETPNPPSLWSDDDFLPIGRAIDKIFAGRGWI